MQQATHDTAPAIDLVEQILAEGPIGMSAVARLCGTYRAGRPTHPSTVTRWAIQGVRLEDGRILKLASIRLGTRLASSKPALIRFLAAQQPNAPDAVTEANRAPSARQKAADVAAEQLDKMGY